MPRHIACSHALPTNPQAAPSQGGVAGVLSRPGQEVSVARPRKPRCQCFFPMATMRLLCALRDKYLPAGHTALLDDTQSFDLLHATEYL
jgi:hypothetical protein